MLRTAAYNIVVLTGQASKTGCRLECISTWLLSEPIIKRVIKNGLSKIATEVCNSEFVSIINVSLDEAYDGNIQINRKENIEHLAALV
jgi:hypothetical protein